MRTALLVVLVLAVGAALGIGLKQAGSESGSGSGHEALTTSASAQAEQLSGAPDGLAALHARASRLIPGGRKALRSELAALRGHPAVVNVWASWCAPCNDEAPIIQRVALSNGKQVGFLGIDLRDSKSGANSFLRRYPVSFPSIEDPDGQVYNDYRLLGQPATAFYDAAGKRTYLHQGAYRSVEDFDADIRRYALGSSS
jgi:cytochrome c biogenesis protein CcmG/thiol:disulfide interchange protein DsbE